MPIVSQLSGKFRISYQYLSTYVETHKTIPNNFFRDEANLERRMLDKKKYVDDNSETPRSLLLSVTYKHGEANSWFLQLSAENARKKAKFSNKGYFRVQVQRKPGLKNPLETFPVVQRLTLATTNGPSD
jgi:hypothetical protein